MRYLHRNVGVARLWRIGGLSLALLVTTACAGGRDLGLKPTTTNGTELPTTGLATSTTAGTVAPSTSVASSSTTAPPPGGGAAQLRQTCLRETANTATRSLVYQPTKHMVVQQSTRVVVVLGNGPIPTGAFNNESTTVVRLATTCAVQAQLTGPDFDITPAGWQRESFIDTPSLTWSWEVEPTHTGNLMLALSLQSVFLETGDEFDSTVDSYTADIAVAAMPVSAAQQARSIFDSPIFDTGLGIASPLVIGGIGWWIKRRRDKKKSPTPPKPPKAKQGGQRRRRKKSANSRQR